VSKLVNSDTCPRPTTWRAGAGAGARTAAPSPALRVKHGEDLLEQRRAEGEHRAHPQRGVELGRVNA
jgi:hypothetical protein